MNYFSVILILSPILFPILTNGQNNTTNNTNTTNPDPRCASVLNRSPLDWVQQALGTASTAFNLGVETGRQWLNFGLNTATNWVTGVHNPNSTTSNSTTTLTPGGLTELAIRREIARLQKELSNKGTWFRKVKERRLSYLVDKLNSLHDNSENNLDNSVTPLDVSKDYFTTTVTKPVQSSSSTTDDTIISVIN